MLPTPLALIAEITHRCPLHCVYCSNPLEMQKASTELPTEDWLRVFREAAKLGVLHLHLTGGEPLARTDLTELIVGARAAGLYVNLITSGIGLTEPRLAALVEAGLEHIQLSFQDSREAEANEFSGTRTHGLKLQLSRIIRQFKIAFTVNVVVHRQNLDHLAEIIAMAEELGPDRLEIANVQYYGWALRNRDLLLPTRLQVEQSQRTVAEAEERLRGRMRIDYTAPDYYARYPKACMGGWGRRLLLLDPAGQVLPCHAAGVIPGMQFDNVREHALDWIWRESAAFQRFRGEDWMPEPCRSCDRRTEDFGGCRCQAFLLTGDAAATDPVCTLAPTHNVVEQALKQISSDGVLSSIPTLPANWIYRPNPSAASE
ncbi:MAG TPA: pyrroloquinoline quinone biosynthesis protein PqqE [Terriglobales bacterium]|jgi:pyrroloquinoline quinone biosynthesis protein E|nr:pyrroloquinoline quinone biosynthesis protein PqqE [Terriglobales bacterium]